MKFDKSYTPLVKMQLKDIDEYLLPSVRYRWQLRDFSYLKQRNETELSDWKNMIQTDYERILCDCIGAVAVYRLSLDAFPVVLADDDLVLRSPDLITQPFSPDFISKYIGYDVIEGYKQIQIYKDTVSWLLSQPKQRFLVTRIDVLRYVHLLKR